MEFGSNNNNATMKITYLTFLYYLDLFKQVGQHLSSESSSLTSSTLTTSASIISVILSSSVTSWIATEVTSLTLWIATEVTCFTLGFIRWLRSLTTWCSIATCWGCLSGNLFSDVCWLRSFSGSLVVVICCSLVVVICRRGSTITWLRFVSSAGISFSFCSNVVI